MDSLPFPIGAATQSATAIESNGRTTSYGQLQRTANGVAERLKHTGLQPGDRVGFAAPNDAHLIVLLWSLWRSELVACPCDYRWPVDRVEDAMQQIAARRFFHSEDVIEMIDTADGSNCTGEPVTDQVATILFSSGSSGKPKAIAHDFHAHCVSAEGANQNMPLTSCDRWLLTLPLFHVAGISVLFRCAAASACIVVAEQGIPLEVQIQSSKITHISLVPTQLKRLMGDGNGPPPSVRAVLLGGAAPPRDLVVAARDAGWPIYTTYGLTEMASQVTTSRRHNSQTPPTSSGAVLEGRELAIDDGGEILVRGGTLFRGYVQGNEIQQRLDADGWFHTGDLGVMDNHGNLTVTGRADNLFVSGGENIYPEEIESCLLCVAGIERAVVVAVDDETYGHRPVAFVDAPHLDGDLWMAELARVLPRFKIPDRFFAWPAGERRMKPDRNAFLRLAQQRMSEEQD